MSLLILVFSVILVRLMLLLEINIHQLIVDTQLNGTHSFFLHLSSSSHLHSSFIGLMIFYQMEAQLSSFVDSCRQQGKNTVWLKVSRPSPCLRFQ